MIFWGALILGFLGSTHCVLMCGPIVMAIPGQKTLGKFILSRLIYNVGRICVYSLLGLIFGFFGQLIEIPQFQQITSIVIGVLISLMAFSFFTSKLESRIQRLSLSVIRPLKSSLQSIFLKSNLTASLFSGMINGLLPCGLVYVALAGALLYSDSISSTVYMVSFGLGTFPAMFAMALLGKYITSLPHYFYKISSFYVFLLGVLLILRGLNLDIPYLSPAISVLYPELPNPTICQ